jgi:serine/threonine protein kinase
MGRQEKVYNQDVASPVTDSDCLDEHDILAFAMGELDGKARGKALEHVDGCESCRRLAAALARDASFQAKTTPEESEDPEQEANEEIGPTSVLTKGELVDGRFRLFGSLGRGAMGTVYRAHDTKLEMDVALKLLEREGSSSERDEKAFARELKVGRRVTHPNVCRLHDAGKHDGLAYITMEIVEGETLAELLAKGPIPLERALVILDGIASGLAAVHSEGIVHRDLKPANVMIERESGRAILTDFGFAADLEAKQSRRLVGTPSFWAPEQARGEKPTPASDVFSFGVLAYRLLTNHEYSFSDADDAIMKVPRGYRAFIETCVAPRPNERYPSANAALTALRNAQRRRSPFVPWIAGAAAALSIAIVGVLAFPQSKPTATTTTPSAPTPTPTPSVTAEPPATATTLTTATSTTGSIAIAPSAPLNPNPNPIPQPATKPRPPASTPSATASAPKPPPAPSASSDPLWRH